MENVLYLMSVFYAESLVKDWERDPTGMPTLRVAGLYFYYMHLDFNNLNNFNMCSGTATVTEQEGLIFENLPLL